VDREQQLTSVLADGTRYRIYRSVVEHPESQVSVSEMAASFGLHPNVARMHLGKLEQAGLLTTTLRRQAGGGRPAKLYGLSDNVASFALPPRHYDLLSGLALTALAEAADIEAVKAVCHREGLEMGRARLAERGDQALDDPVELAGVMGELAEQFGMLPVVEFVDGELDIDVRNCVFKELSTARPDLVCAMHRAFLVGMIEALGGETIKAQLEAETSISHGDDRCRLRLKLT